jgi:hypothetical protein
MPEMTMRIFKTARLLLLSGAATAALMGSAFALDAQAFVDRLTTVSAAYGYGFEFGPARLDGDTIIVDGFTLSVDPSEAVAEPMTMDAEITFSGVTEGSDGSFTAETITIPDIDTEFASEPAGRLTLTDVRLGGLYLPGDDPAPAVMSLQLLESASTGPLVVTRDGVEIFSIDSMESVTTFNPAQGSLDLVDVHAPFAINGIWADLGQMNEDDKKTAATIEKLGLSTISGDITGHMSWSMADGHMNIEEFLFDFADIGALDITLDITGFTPAVLDQMYAIQAAMPPDGEMTEDQAQAQMMAGMALLQGINIVGASVRYDDASLAGRLLEHFAAEAGTDRATHVENLKAGLPAMLAGSGIPALNDIVIPPLSAFLDDPQSLEFRVSPPSPTSLLVLMAAAANPAGLITALGFTVEANSAAE